MVQGYRGFTLTELIVTIGIVSISVALALPSFNAGIEKREITSAAEEIVSFITFVQTEAIKRNQFATVSWYSPGGHNRNWCIGATMGATACNCRQTSSDQADFCEIEGAPMRLFQSTFVDVDDEFLHTNRNLQTGTITFDPIRGVMTNVSSALATELAADDYLFYLHSNSGSGSSRNYELEIRVNLTGRMNICTDDGRKMLIGGYPEC